MFRIIRLLITSLLIIACVNARASIIRVFDESIAVEEKPARSAAIPQIMEGSVTLKITAYNDDPSYRRTVYFDIDGIGGQIAYGLTSNITCGYVQPKSTKTWIINLSKTYSMVVRTTGSYSLVENSDQEKLVNYGEILSKPGIHTINCYVAVSDQYAPKSTVSVELITGMYNPSDRKKEHAKITIDDISDPRIALSVKKLNEITDRYPYNKYEYLIGKGTAKSYIPPGSLADLGDQGFVIAPIMVSGKTVIAVAGKTNQGTAYGVMRLVRTLKAYPGDLSKLSIKMKPAYPIRVMYEERPWCKQEEVPMYRALLNRYLEETVNIADMWGVPLPPDPRYITTDYVYKQPYGDADTLQASIDYAHSLGMKAFIVDICQMSSFLDVPIDKTRNIDKEHYSDLLAQMQSGGHDPTMLCLSNKTSLDIIRRDLELKCQTVKNMDGFTAYFADPGGCWCKNCRPWGKTIIRALNDIYAPAIEKINPKLKVVLSLWGLEIDDVRYVVDHLEELPACVVALQIPPTSMVPNKYLTFEPRIVPLIRKASKKYPVILQQFYDGVGFKDAGVSIWEHPMPVDITSNLRNCDIPHGTVKGVYGSSFRLGDQLVDLRLGMELGWERCKNPEQILAEFGNEHFGPMIGRRFANAMFAMEEYWSTEAKRFHFITAALTQGELQQCNIALNKAITAEAELRAVEPYVVSNKLYYKGSIELAELMRRTAEANINGDAAWKAFEHGDLKTANKAINAAITASDRAIDIISGSDHYAWLMQHPWWKLWSIGARPSIYRNAATIFLSSKGWGIIQIDDPSFEDYGWNVSGKGSFVYTIDGSTGQKCARLQVKAPDDYVAISSRPVVILPNCRYNITFRAKCIGGSPSVYLDWYSDEGIDGGNFDVEIADGNEWKPYIISVNSPAMENILPLSLRFVAIGAQDILIDDVRIEGPVPK